MPIGYILIKTLRQGTEVLEEGVKEQVRSFVRSQMMDDESFMNRGGKSDLYYTMFGWMLCYVLDMETSDEKRKQYLENVDIEALDDLHRTVFKQCVLLDELLGKGLIKAAMNNWKSRHHIEDFFKSFVKHTVSRTVNGEAASMFVGERHDDRDRKEKLEWIVSMQDETGGFWASEVVALPDLLTTAVALFTLKSFGVKTRYEAVDFVDVHFSDDGSFMPNLIDEKGDVEYVFYGLLALGSL